MQQLTTTDATAIYAAIVATGALALEIRRWFESGPKLTLTLIPIAKLFGGIEPDENEYLCARITNRGDRPTTITNFALHQYRSLIHRHLNRAFRSAIVPRPEVGGGIALPHVLQPGTQWAGMAIYNAELIDWARTGALFVAIYSSGSRRPIKRKVRGHLEFRGHNTQ